jgi:hypothetical protein
VTVEQFRALIAAIKDLVPYEVYNIAHLVLDDNNFEDSHIKFCLTEIPKIADEYMHDHSGVTIEQINGVVRFLLFLLSIPEEVREAYRPDDVEVES